MPPSLPKSLLQPSPMQCLKPRPISTYGYTQAKSLVYSQHGNPSDVLSLHTSSLPPPHSTLLTLRTLASPLNPADINQIQGTYATLPPFTTTLGTPQPSAVPGNEGCFEVVSAGSGAKSVKRGDWVIARRTGMGAWRTHLQVEETGVMRVEKEGVTAGQVGTVAVNPVTAYRMLKDFVRVGEGDWVVLNGANSGVGRAVLQLCRRWGIRAIGVVRGREGVEGEMLRAEMEALGAERVVTEVEMGGKGFGELVKGWTRGGREEVKLGLNCVGGESAMNMAKILSPEGTLVTYGAMSKNPMRVGAGTLIFKDIRFVGFWVSRWSDANPEEKKRTVDELLGFYRDGSFRDVPVVEVPWGWDTRTEELVEAVQGTLEGYRKGKGLFVFGDT